MGKYLNMLGEGGLTPGISGAEQKVVGKQGPVEAKLLMPGDRITWLGNEAPAKLDCLHTEPDGTVWAFVTLPDGWAALNAKFVTTVRTF